MKRLLLRVSVAAICMLLVAGAWAWHTVTAFMRTAPESPGRDITIRVRPGASFAQVARQLAEHGLVSDARKFHLLARYRQQTGVIQAGEFLFNTGWTPDIVLNELVYGMPVQHRLHFPEGLPWWEVARILEREGFARSEDVNAVVHDPVFLREHGIPFDSAEGFLFPETYRMDKPEAMTPETARIVVGRLVDMFWRKTGVLWPQGRPDPEELRRLVILATLVEKETSVPEERAIVAGVYANRMRLGMLMQADPTIIYGIGPGFDGNITRADLRNATNPYNTYTRRGLPPGPICSPGVEALRAALNPAPHKFLYFVAKGDGTHHFSKTLPEHNAAVRRYQLRR